MATITARLRCRMGTTVITVTAAYGGASASCAVEVVGDVTITASAGEHGKITPSGSVPAKSNEKTTFAIIPDYGYVVKDVQVNSTSVGAVDHTHSTTSAITRPFTLISRLSLYRMKTVMLRFPRKLR